MKSKWIINNEKLKGYIIGEDRGIYRLPFEENGKHFALRKMKKQYGERYRLAGEWWSQNQLKPFLELDKNPIVLFENEKEVPF